MNKFIVVSDIHLHLWNYGTPFSRLRSILEDLNAAITFAYEDNIDAILFCGDIFHTHGTISTEVLNETFIIFDRHKHLLRKKAVYIPGNHDLTYKDNDYNNPTSICFLKNFGKLSNYISNVEINNNFPIIHCIPYTESEAYLKRGLDLCTDDSILILHQGVSNVELNSKGFTLNELLKPEMIPNNILHAFSGHYHTKKSISSKLTIPGALVQHTFADSEDERGFLEVTIENKNIEILFHPSTNHYKFIRIPYSEDLYSKRRELQELEMENFIAINNVPSNETIRLNHFISNNLNSSVKLNILKQSNIEFQKADTKFKSLTELFELFIKQNNLSDSIIQLGKKLINETDKIDS